MKGFARGLFWFVMMAQSMMVAGLAGVAALLLIPLHGHPVLIGLSCVILLGGSYCAAMSSIYFLKGK